MWLSYLQEAQGVCTAHEALTQQAHDLDDELVDAEGLVRKRKRRGVDVEAALEEQRRKRARKAAFVGSEEYARSRRDVRRLLGLLPELALRFPEADPFYGTAAQVASSWLAGWLRSCPPGALARARRAASTVLIYHS